MKYVWDSSSLIKLFGNFPPPRFPSLWKKFDKLVEGGRIVSVREARREVADHGDPLSTWANERKDTFHEPTKEDLEFVERLFRNKHHQGLIKKKNLMDSAPVADPFVMAKAKSLAGCAVTEDGFFRDGGIKPNAPLMAPICEILGIDCVHLDGFMQKEDWRF